MESEWNRNGIGMFCLTEQQLAGQVLCIGNGKYLPELEIEEIRRKIDEPTQTEVEKEQTDSNVNTINESGAKQSIDSRVARQVNLEPDKQTEQREILEMLKGKLRQPEICNLLT